MVVDIVSVGVVGGGLMGAGIAEVCARAGLDVIVREVTDAAAQVARQRVAGSLDRAVGRGKLAAGDAEATLGRIRFTTAFEDLTDVGLAIEAVAEDEAVKLEVFAQLDAALARPDALLASNTSSIPIMKLAMATGRPEQVVGIHFFNPVPVLPLVEMVTSLVTRPEVVADAEAFVVGVLGKTVIRSSDRAGFVVNALLVPYLLSAVRMLESGFATAADIDQGMVLGCAHPMGPLRLADLIGLDTVTAIAQSMYQEFREPLYSPPPLLMRMVSAGLLGRKSGRGFHAYA
ncbi:3-hydroxybutyryl-CoA dehydrogenase [Pseudofrankia asymbiotica]|nr:3-hydroxybutyryl-CoA dehydrogenase [Pseudofrankia asymbiotica]